MNIEKVEGEKVLSKAKRRRLRKKKLLQTPKEDGGEAEAELTPDAEKELKPIIEAVVTSIDLSAPRKYCALISKKAVHSAAEFAGNDVHVRGVSRTPPAPEPRSSHEDRTMADTSKQHLEKKSKLQNKPSPSKVGVKDDKKVSKQNVGSSKGDIATKPLVASPTKTSPKASETTGKPSAVTKNESVLPQQHPASSKQTAELASEQKPPENIETKEKTREEIVAERKAKKAEKAAKKGKSGKENTTPSQDTKAKDVKTEVSLEQTSKADKNKPEVASELPVTDTQESKSKATLKEERRLKQEAQRAAKVAASASKQVSTVKKDVKTTTSLKVAEEGKPALKTKSNRAQSHLAKLLSHLQRRNSPPPSLQYIHPAIVKLGLQYSQHQVAGSNARAVALMRAMKKVIEDYETPAQSELRRDLEHKMQVYMDYLAKCRPISVSMSNCMRDLKSKVQHLPYTLSDLQAKNELISAITGNDNDGFIDKLELDCRSASAIVVEKIKDSDIILTYGCSSLVKRMLLEAKSQGKKFRVVIVGASPWKEAEKMLQQLTDEGVRCSYLFISAISSVIQQVTKVLMGAHAVFANGYVMARAGSSQVALVAHSYNVPVIFCCETYKFCYRTQTDAFAYNELGDADELIRGLQMPHLTQCVLAYDVTPADLVSTVVTEVSMLPVSSIPIVLHMQSSETRLKRKKTAARCS